MAALDSRPQPADPVSGARPGPLRLASVSLWRLAVIVFALVGLTNVPGGGFEQLQYLSQLASLVAAVAYGLLLVYPLLVGGARHEPATPWLRGAMTVLLTLVSVTFLTLLDGGLDTTGSLFEHLLTPLIVLVDWIAVGRNQRNVRWWFPITWLGMPLAYLLFYVVYVRDGRAPLYPFLDPRAGDFLGVVGGFLVGVLAAGYVIYAIGRMRAPRNRDRRA